MGSGGKKSAAPPPPQEGPIETPVTDELKQDKGISRAAAQNRLEGSASPSLLDDTDEQKRAAAASANLLG